MNKALGAFARAVSPLAEAFQALGVAIHQATCDHVCDANELRHISHDLGSAERIEATCVKCSKVLRGPYGLALPCAWGRRQDWE